MAFFPPVPLRWVAAALVCVLTGSLAGAAELESRAFRISVDGKPAGAARMIIQHWEDGSISVRCDTDITVTIVGFIKAYQYSYHGHETWKDGQLLRLDSSSNDDGKRFRVVAVVERKGLRVIVNNNERMEQKEVWVTSYWRLPPAKMRSGTLSLLDADTGRNLSASLRFVGTEKRKLAGQEAAVNHYKLQGDVNVELWYDGSERLVRQQWVEDGHRVLLELDAIER